MRNRDAARKKAEALVAQMTLEEKASQLRYDAPAIPRLGVPAYNWWNEALHGVARAGTATSFPQAIGMAAAFDPELMTRVGEIIATEGRAKYNAYSRENDRDIYKGLTFWSPNVNIFRDPRWGRGQETYGEDPYLTATLGVRFIKGLQGDGDVLKAAACAKHFAVHSGPEHERHEFDAQVSQKDLWETYLPAFEACVRDGDVEAVMGAYNRTNGEPCCGHSVLMEKILRGQWGFKGHYVSDCWAIRDFHTHHMVTNTATESAALALKSGCDVNCGNTYLHILKAFMEGLVTEADITRAAERLFTTRYMLGLFEETEYDQIPYTVVECREHLEAAAQAARESMVLLKNDGILPLDRHNIRTIGVIGPNADSRRVMIGNYYGTSSHATTVLEGIQALAGEDIRVLYSEGCHLYKDRVEHLAWPKDRLSEAVIVAKHSDVVILCVGLDETLEGEEVDPGNSIGSGDKQDLLLPAPQRELLDRLLAQDTPVIVCLMAGSAIDIQEGAHKAAAILQTWYPGAGAGTQVGEILFGHVSPSGKLPVTFYHNSDLEHMPDFTDYAMAGRTYRYLEREPLYPFGYGLTYGDVQVTAVEMADAVDDADGQCAACGPVNTTDGDIGTASWTGQRQLHIRATVVNKGSRATADVVQVYIKDLESPWAVKNHSLCGFSRVYLEPGEEKVLSIQVPESAFTIVDDEGRRYRHSRRFRLYVGTSQPDGRSVALTGTRPVEVMVEF